MIQGTKIIEKTESAYEYPLLLKQLLNTPIDQNPNQEIVYRDSVRYSFREYGARIKKLASGLSAIGVGPGDMVAVLDWDSHRYLECYFGVPGIGAVLHCVNVRLSPEQVFFTMNHAEDKVVVIHEEFLPLVESIKDRLGSVKKWILIKESDKPIESSIPFDCEYEELLARGSEDFEFPDFDENSMATLFYTTGTTGDPKGVFFSHRQLVIHTLAVSVATGALPVNRALWSGSVYMPITPMFHVHAWGMPYIAVMLGAKIVLPGRYEPDLLLELIQKEKVTFSHCVPTILQMLLASPRIKEADLSHWSVNIGGSALPKGLAKEAMDMGINIFAGYGMSETGPVLTVANVKPKDQNAPEEEQLKIRTATGLPIPLVNLRVVDPMMNDMPRDGKSAGEIVVRTPYLTQSYFKNPSKGEELWKNGWLHTGDVAHIDQEGYVRITDRIKDVIKTGGEWVSSLLLEDLISQHPAVAEVAVVGVPDDKWGERPMAMITPAASTGDDFPIEEVRKFLMKFVDDGTISKYMVPDRIEVVSEIPKTSVGKLDKKVIRVKAGQ